MGRSDIGWANVFMIPERKKYVDFTEPFLIDRVSFMLRKCSFRMITELQQKIILREKLAATSMDADFHPTAEFNMARKCLFNICTKK